MIIIKQLIESVIFDLYKIEDRNELDPMKLIEISEDITTDEFVLDIPLYKIDLERLSLDKKSEVKIGNKLKMNTSKTVLNGGPRILGLYSQMLYSNCPKIFLFRDNIKDFTRRILANKSDGSSKLEAWKVIVTVINLVYTVYNHERFHFYMEMQRKLLKLAPYKIDEEAYANAFAYHSVKYKGLPLNYGNGFTFLFDPTSRIFDKYLRINKNIDRKEIRSFSEDIINRIFSTFTLPGYRDWILFKDNYFSHLQVYINAGDINSLGHTHNINVEEYLELDLGSKYRLEIEVNIV